MKKTKATNRSTQQSIRVRVTGDDEQEFMIEVHDPKTKCLLYKQGISANSGSFFLSLNLTKIADHAIVELDAHQVATINNQFKLKLNKEDGEITLRQREKFDDLPYELHSQRELDLMLLGIKPLAAFNDEDTPDFGMYQTPETLFDAHVEQGRFVKREYVERLVQERPLIWRTILYALPAEAWRIEAYILVHQTANKTGWNEALVRIEGSLLGYEEWQNDAYVHFQKK